MRSVKRAAKEGNQVSVTEMEGRVTLTSFKLRVNICHNGCV